jgi:hypothetical protein
LVRFYESLPSGIFPGICLRARGDYTNKGFFRAAPEATSRHLDIWQRSRAYSEKAGARPQPGPCAPVHEINASAIAEASVVEKSVVINRTPRARHIYDAGWRPRYYAPTAFNTPRTLDKIFNDNDVQLFDLQNDPDEMHNFAIEPDKNRGADFADERATE